VRLEDGIKAERVREVAYERKLPFSLKELRGHAQRGEKQAWVTYSSTKSDQAEWPQHVRQCVNELVAAGASEEEVKSGSRPPPDDERIRKALEIFTQPEEWKHLLEGCGYEEARAFRNFLVANKGELETLLGSEGYKWIYLNAFERGLVSGLRGKVEVYDIWAPPRVLRLWQVNRALNRQGLSSFGNQRSTAEEASARGIASKLASEAKEAGLKLHDKKVKKWLTSLKQEPLDDFKGNITMYVLKTCYPKAYDRLRRKHKTEE
jgi:hypothetical protein